MPLTRKPLTSLLGSVSQGRERHVLIAFFAFTVLTAIPARSDVEETTGATSTPALAVAPDAPPSTTPAVATVGKVEDVTAQPSEDEQRRVLMLLLMRSGGPVRPYGNFGH